MTANTYSVKNQNIVKIGCDQNFENTQTQNLNFAPNYRLINGLRLSFVD